MLLNVLQSVEERQPASEPDAVWHPSDPPLPIWVKLPVSGEEAVSVEVATLACSPFVPMKASPAERLGK